VDEARGMGIPTGFAEECRIMGGLARRNRLPADVALCHIRLPDVGPRAVPIVRIVAIITGAGIVAVIPVVRMVAVIPIAVVGIAVTPPIRRVDPSEPEPAAEMPKAMVGPTVMKPTAVKATAMEPGNPAAVKTPPP